jgi:sugar fermentation stimulation protein A
MKFNPPLIAGTLIKRYKRFLADIELRDGQIVTAHCPNPGSMLSCQEPGWEVRLSYHPSPKRKLAYTLEMLYSGEVWIGVNTAKTNALVKEALEAKIISELVDYTQIKTEVRYGEKSRIDFVLSAQNLPDCFLEVKQVSLCRGAQLSFPDSVSERAKRHLQELLNIQAQGARAVLLFVITREDGLFFSAAADIDPTYAEALEQARKKGLEILVYRASVSPEQIFIDTAFKPKNI